MAALFDDRPDPSRARTAPEFLERMRLLKSWSGLSYRQLSARARHAGDVLPHSTIASALGPSRTGLPREELVAAFVRACGCDRREAGMWLAARRRLAVATAGSAAAPGTGPAPERAADRRIVGGAVALTLAGCAVAWAMGRARAGSAGPLARVSA